MVMIKRGRERKTLVDSEDSFAYKLAVQKTSEEFKTLLLVLKCPKVRDSRKTFLVMQDIGRKISGDNLMNTKFT